MKVTAIMATCGRHYCSERSLSLFLNQDYRNKHLVIFQNSDSYQRLAAEVDPEMVTLINSHKSYETGTPYTNLGSIYKDAMVHVPVDTDVIIFWDDDDIFLEEHISKGVGGLLRSGKTAYKPAWSYFRNHEGIFKAQNTFEPSIFVKAGHIKKHGFNESTTDQHLKWLNPLLTDNEIYIDEGGEPTLIYNWGDPFYTYKTSGNAGNPEHFSEYRVKSVDHGDGLITPMDISEEI